MKKTACLLLACLSLLLSGCGPKTEEPMEEVYMNITPEEAKRIMDTETGYIILDVRTEAEFAERHIPGAILIPDYELAERAEAELPDQDQMILVYCRSGRRSKNAAQILVSLGYTKIREFGGIIDWPYETE